MMHQRALQHQVDRFALIPNNIRSDVCKLCSVNRTRFREEDNKNWWIDNICSGCDMKVPYFRVSVSQVSTFPKCQLLWWYTQVERIPTGTNKWAVYGTLVHALDEFIIEFLGEKKNYDMMRAVYPSRVGMMQLMLRLIQDFATQRLGGDRQLIDNADFAELIENQVFVYTARVYNDIKFGGEYRDILTKRWVEKEVVGEYKAHGVRLQILGHIDKLYQIGEDVWFVRDDKTKVRLKDASEDRDYSLQLGGYAYCLEQMYKHKVETFGLIWWSSYFEMKPVPVDVSGFTEILDKICRFLSESKDPKKATHGTWWCKTGWCFFHPSCYPNCNCELELKVEST